MRHILLSVCVAIGMLAAAPASADIAPDPEDVDARLMELARSAGHACPSIRVVARYQGADQAALRAGGLSAVVVTCGNGVRLMIADLRRFRRGDRSPRGTPVVRLLSGRPAAPVKTR